jgi:Right handed beta helix region
MHCRTARLLVVLGAMALLYALPVHAATVSVGTCLPAYPHFSTIQSAINASPLGGTVLVCPGTYPEQLSIFHPLTLKGVDNGSSNLVLITMPTGGTGAQVYVQATSVNISDVTIDGANNGVTYCGIGPYGIWYNGASGTVNHVALRNQFPSGPGLACFDPSGVVVSSSLTSAAVVTVQNSSIHQFQGNGIEVYGQGSTLTAKYNTLGGKATGAGGNGIAVFFGAAATLTSNSISDVNEPVSFPNIFAAGFGVLIECSQGVIMSSNNVSNVQVGVYITSGCASTTGGNGDSNTITKNTFSQTHIFDALYVCGNYNLLQSNTINGTSEAAVRFDSSCNPNVSGYFNTFSSNTTNEACTQSLVDPAVAGANTIGSNTSYNLSYDRLSGTVLPAGLCSSSGAPAKPIQQTASSTRFLPHPPHR